MEMDPKIFVLMACIMALEVQGQFSAISFNQNCEDSDDHGEKDSHNDGCEYYSELPSVCGKFDDEDFKSKELCCACKDPDPREYIPMAMNMLWNINNAVAANAGKISEPTAPGCWMRYPSGCPKKENEDSYKKLQNPRNWNRDTYNGASDSRDKCYAREEPVNKWCGVSDVIIHYVSDN